MFKATKWIESCKSIEDVLDNHMNELVLSEMNMDNLKIITTQALKDYGTKKKLVLSEKAADIVTEMLKEYGFISLTKREGWVDQVVAAVYLHNLFVKEDDWTSVFDARRELQQEFIAAGAPEQIYDPIFCMIEAQFGEKMPVGKCRVIKNSPSELFFWAIWFSKSLLTADSTTEKIFVATSTKATAETAVLKEDKHCNNKAVNKKPFIA